MKYTVLGTVRGTGQWTGIQCDIMYQWLTHAGVASCAL